MSESRDYMESVGIVATLMSRSPIYCGYPVACLSEWIRPPILLNQIFFFRPNGGAVTGYVTWAFLTEEAELRLKTDPHFRLRLSEWNEGERLWIMDFLLNEGNPSVIIRTMLKGFFSSHSQAFSVRRSLDGSVRRITNWRRRSISG